MKVGDLVVSIGMNSRDYGIGRITAIHLNVATVVFGGDRIESFNFAMLKSASLKPVLAKNTKKVAA